MITEFNPTLSHRLDGVGEYYFSRKLREIESLRKQGKSIISLGIGRAAQRGLCRLVWP